MADTLSSSLNGSTNPGIKLLTGWKWVTLSILMTSSSAITICRLKLVSMAWFLKCKNKVPFPDWPESVPALYIKLINSWLLIFLYSSEMWFRIMLTLMSLILEYLGVGTLATYLERFIGSEIYWRDRHRVLFTTTRPRFAMKASRFPHPALFSKTDGGWKMYRMGHTPIRTRAGQAITSNL